MYRYCVSMPADIFTKALPRTYKLKHRKCNSLDKYNTTSKSKITLQDFAILSSIIFILITS